MGSFEVIGEGIVEVSLGVAGHLVLVGEFVGAGG